MRHCFRFRLISLFLRFHFLSGNLIVFGFLIFIILAPLTLLLLFFTVWISRHCFWRAAFCGEAELVIDAVQMHEFFHGWEPFDFFFNCLDGFLCLEHPHIPSRYWFFELIADRWVNTAAALFNCELNFLTAWIIAVVQFNLRIQGLLLKDLLYILFGADNLFFFAWACVLLLLSVDQSCYFGSIIILIFSDRSDRTIALKLVCILLDLVQV